MELTAQGQTLILERIAPTQLSGDLGCCSGLVSQVLSCPLQQLSFINSGN